MHTYSEQYFFVPFWIQRLKDNKHSVIYSLIICNIKTKFIKNFQKLAKSNLFDSFRLNAGEDSTHRVVQCHSHVRVTVKNKGVSGSSVQLST